jgi:hypothetical protein
VVLQVHPVQVEALAPPVHQEKAVQPVLQGLQVHQDHQALQVTLVRRVLPAPPVHQV